MKSWVLLTIVLVGGAFAAPTLGCSSDDEAKKKETAADLSARLKGMNDPGPSQRFDNTELVVKSFDLDRDNSADLWKVFKVGKENVDDLEETVRLVRKEVDTNFDGKVDVWYLYNIREKLFREEADANFDGEVDLVTYFENARVVKREVFAAGKQFPKATKNYREGRLYKIEVDETSDGSTDRWEIYTNGRLVQVGHDLKGNGKVDFWQNFD